MFSFNSEQQKMNTQKLKSYVEQIENNKEFDKDHDRFIWNIQSFMPQQDPTPTRLELVKFKNLFKQKPRTHCERARCYVDFSN